MLKGGRNGPGTIDPDASLTRPSIPGITVGYFACRRYGMWKFRDLRRNAEILERLPAAQADMRARKQRQGNHHE